MVSLLLTAALLTAEPPPAPSPTPTPTAEPAPTAKPAKPPKPSPDERLAQLDDARLELHFGIAGYGRFLAAEPAYGGGATLGAGVRVVRGLYLVGELGAGAHAMPLGAGAKLFIGARHELRVSKWVRPTFSLGYTHLVDATFDASFDGDCGCFDWNDHDHRHPDHPELGVSGDGEVELAQRSGVQAGMGLRFPMRWAPRLSVYLRGDLAYYFDDRPGRLQAGLGGGLQVVF